MNVNMIFFTQKKLQLTERCDYKVADEPGNVIIRFHVRRNRVGLCTFSRRVYARSFLRVGYTENINFDKYTYYFEVNSNQMLFRFIGRLHNTTKQTRAKSVAITINKFFCAVQI